MTAVRVVVVGAGVVGLLTALECALAGHRVTVLDRGPIPNPAASSADQHRALRTLVVGNPAATRRLVRAERRWRELERLLGTPFYRRVGVVTAWPAERVEAVLRSAAAAGLPVAPVGPGELAPLGLPPGSTGLREQAAGVLLARRVLRALAGRLAGHPAVTLRPRTAVTAVRPADGLLETAGGERIGGDLVLLAAGPWTRELVAEPVLLHRQTVVYLRPPARLARWWHGVGAVGGLGRDGRGWALPPVGGTLLKVSSHTLCREVAGTGLAGEDQAGWAERLVGEGLLREAGEYAVVGVRACHYTSDAGTGGARLTRLGPGLWARSACGGSGFAAAPLVADRIVRAAAEAAA
ncbi:NAD(P)/FAD-dependent oxidoreductase [Kitasatospora sp. NPDC058965]|uniref:NAD(P)/FAD-dependent oxidoreductase n=1 Tax=Kitasatospora sp. NPDC058965 TaxID=3346682 RepID=UPI003673F4C4